MAVGGGSRDVLQEEDTEEEAVPAEATALTQLLQDVQAAALAGNCAVPRVEDTDGFGAWRHAAADLNGGRAAAILTASVVMAAYYRTLSPSITGGDSGEVMAAACSGGPAHPPGYPLFIASANLAMWLFASLGENTAYRVNLMCAILTAMAVYNLHRAARIITRSSAAATVGAAMYGFSPLIWNNALQAEVFSMNNAFVCLITHLLVRYLGRNDAARHSDAYKGAFAVGLGLSNQHTLILYAAIIVPAVFISGWRRLLRPVPFLCCTLLFTLGMLPYSHMWWLEGCPIPWAEKDQKTLGTKYCPRFEHVPMYSWGDRRSFTGFWNHLLRKDYGTFVLAAGGADAHGKPVSLVQGLLFYLEDIAGPRLDERRRGHTKSHEGQLLYVGVPCALAGVGGALYGRCFGRHLAACRTLVVCYVFYALVFHSLANLPIKVPLFLAVHARFWQMPNSTLFLFVALGFDLLSRRFVDAGDEHVQLPPAAAAAAGKVPVHHARRDRPTGAEGGGRGRSRSPGGSRGGAGGFRVNGGGGAAEKEGRGRDIQREGAEGEGLGREGWRSREGCGQLAEKGDGWRCAGDGWRRWAVACLLVWLQFINNYATQDQSGNYAMEQLTRMALETLPPNAIVLCSGDLQFNPGLYMTRCEGVRPDVAFISLQLMSYRWYGLNGTIKWPGVVFPGRSHWPDEHGYSLQKFFEANLPARPIHVYGGNRPAETLERLLEDASLSEEQFYHWPWGLTDRMVSRFETPRVPLHEFARDHAKAWAPMEEWERAGHLPYFFKNGEDTWEDQIVREFYIGYHRLGHHAMEYYQTLPGEDCGGNCPEGCDCEYTMGKTMELARHAYSKLADAHLNYTSHGLEVPFNWDGAVHQALGTIDEYEGNAVGMLWNWWRFLDAKKDSDIMSTVIRCDAALDAPQSHLQASIEYPSV